MKSRNTRNFILDTISKLSADFNKLVIHLVEANTRIAEWEQLTQRLNNIKGGLAHPRLIKMLIYNETKSVNKSKCLPDSYFFGFYSLFDHFYLSIDSDLLEEFKNVISPYIINGLIKE